MEHSGSVSEPTNFDQENPGSNPVLIHCSRPLKLTNEYLTIDSGGYLCTNTFRVLIAAWLETP